MKDKYLISEFWSGLFFIFKNEQKIGMQRTFEEAKSLVPIGAKCFSRLKKFKGRKRLMKPRKAEKPSKIEWGNKWP